MYRPFVNENVASRCQLPSVIVKPVQKYESFLHINLSVLRVL